MRCREFLCHQPDASRVGDMRRCTNMTCRFKALFWLAALAITATALPAAVGFESIRDDDVQLAIGRGVDSLWSQQGFDGRWVSPSFEKTFPNGLTALCLYTLRSAGISPSHARLRRPAFSLLNATDVNTVYARSFRLLSWCEIDPAFLTKQIDEDIHFMKLDQTGGGGWGYGRLSVAGQGRSWADNSNSQLALLALAAATSVGAEVQAKVWRRAEQGWLTSQNTDGGWGYPLPSDSESVTTPKTSYGSMTAGGLASLYLIYDQLHLDAELAFNGRFKARCGKDMPKTRAIRQAMSRAWTWWDEHFRTDTIPEFEPDLAGDLHEAYLSYYLYGAARLGVLSGRKRFGDRVWARELVERLMQMQRPDGSWGRVDQTCFAILALTKARTPVLINKLAYGDQSDWNTDRRDAANLTQWFSKASDKPVTWQVLELSSNPSDINDAPVVLLTGHNPPDLSPDGRTKLRDFVTAGGTILAVACCSKDEFVDGCRMLFSDLFPRLTYGPLSEDHPVWTMHDSLPPGDDCLGFGSGCRTSIFILPNAACCAWQQNLVTTEQRRFKLAGNILRYATFGRPLESRLTPFIETNNKAKPTTTVTAARLEHGGDFWVDPDALKHLSNALSLRIGLGIDERGTVRASDLRSGGLDVLFATGHTFKPPGPNGRVYLKSCLSAGAVLVASACCGAPEFDESFRSFAIQLFGPDAWRPIPADDPLKTGSFAPGLGVPLKDLSFRQRHRDTGSAYFQYPLLYGIWHKGRWVVVYSPYDLTCAFTKHPCLSCVGYVSSDAQAIVGNILLQVAKKRSTGE